MNIPLCGVPIMLAFFAYVVSGVVLSARMLKHGIGGRAPVGLAVYRKDSYTPEGQRLLMVFRKWWVFRAPLVLLAAGITGGLFCNLIGW